MDIVSELAPKKRAVFVEGDPGIVSMQEDLKRLKLQQFREGRIKQNAYENANGVFLRFSRNGAIYSGIIQTEDKNETRGLLLELPPRLHKEGVYPLTIKRTPQDRIPLFPFFTVLDGSELADPKKKLSKQYWSRFSDDIQALRSWHLDRIRFRKEIINTEAPQLEAAVPSWMTGLKIYVLYNAQKRTIVTRYYRSLENRSAVWVAETSGSPSLEGDTWAQVFVNAFDLPSKRNLVLETTQFSREGETVYSKWDHPYFSAVEDVKKQIEGFNRAQPGILYDAYLMSPSLVHYWTAKRIRKTRELSDKFPILNKVFESWLKPIQALLLYFVDEPIRGRITDGIITAYYVNGETDEILVKRVEKKEDTKWNEDLVKEYFPKSAGKPMFGFSSSILHYLRDKLGAD